MTDRNRAAPAILFVDDEATTVKYFKQAMESLAAVATAASVEEGKRVLDGHAQSLAVVVSDQRMPGGCGNALLQYARQRHPHMVRILTTAYSELDHTIEAVNQGQIHRYIQKPWEVGALRMEIKQALDFAALRKEHAELLAEKMMVRQRQTLSNRIGALSVLCGSLLATGGAGPLETYLAAAAAAGIEPSAVDWQAMDYADLVEAEAGWAGGFGHALSNRLAVLRQRHRAWRAEDGLAALADELEGWGRLAADGSLVFTDMRNFAEFLEATPDTPVSARHVSWLALLLWLHERGCALEWVRTEGGMQGRLGAVAPPVPVAQWLRRLGGM